MICLHCNGYYGPAYGQPICATCHMFLYPGSPFHSLFWYDFKGEDGDSGNEEPREPPECNTQNEASGSEEVNLVNLLVDNHQIDPSQSIQFLPFESVTCEKVSNSSIQQASQELVSKTLSSNSHNERSKSQASNSLSDRHSPNHKRSLYEGSHEWKGSPYEKDNSAIENNEAELSLAVNISSLPPEVLVVIFSFLDEVSLWAVNLVCRSWNELVQQYTCDEQWEFYTHRRWPLFNPIYDVSNWKKVFTNLMESAPCQFCFLRMPYENISEDHENSWRKNRLSNELRTLRSDPPEGICASPLDVLCLRWQASIRGPAGSPYQGGTFFLYIQIPPSYPLRPPLVRFTTRIFHPNVARHGDIGIDSIQHNWSLALTISKVLISIQSLLTDPYTKICMEPKIGDIYDNNRSQFERIAKAWTWRYAMHDAIDPHTVTSDYIQRITSDNFQLQKQEELDIAETLCA